MLVQSQAVVGGIMQGRAQRRAARENRRQQDASLAFQEKQIKRGEEQLDKGFRFARESVLGNIERQSADLQAQLASRGIDAAGTIGLGAQRAAASDANAQLQQLYANIAQSKAALYQGQSFPMIMQQGPQGNYAMDAARLATMIGSSGSPSFSSSQLAAGGAASTAAGRALSSSGLGIFGAPLQMAGQGMTSAASSE